MLRGLLNRHITQEHADLVLLKAKPGERNSPLHLRSACLARGMPLQDTVDGMRAVMDYKNGVGLSGVQVGFPYRIAVMQMKAREADHMRPARDALPFTVLINPKVVEKSTEEVIGWESCLSIDDLYIKLPRASMVRVRYLDLAGHCCERVMEGWHARVVQHEIDHMDGILFSDKMEELGLDTLSSDQFRAYLATGVIPAGMRVTRLAVKDPTF